MWGLGLLRGNKHYGSGLRGLGLRVKGSGLLYLFPGVSGFVWGVSGFRGLRFGVCRTIPSTSTNIRNLLFCRLLLRTQVFWTGFWEFQVWINIGAIIMTYTILGVPNYVYSRICPGTLFYLSLGGSWVVTSGVISPLIWVITYNYSYPTYNPTYIYP